MIEAYKVIPKGTTSCVLVVKCVGQENTKDMELPVSGERITEHFTGFNANLIQNVFPELNPDQREFLISGSTPEEWEAMFGGEEE